MLSFRRRKPLNVLPAEMTFSPRRPNAVVAAATRIVQQPNGYPLRITREAWTNEAWRQYDICGELHFATSWLSNSVGRCQLTVCEIDDQGNIGHPTKDPEILAISAGLLMNPGLQNELLTDLTKNLTIAGDCYILGEADPATGIFDRWRVLSVSEVQTGVEGTMVVNIGDGVPRTLYLDQVLLIRVHRPHPRLWFQADSPTRAALPVLRELEELSKYLFATINSRLAGAGILGVPSEMNFPSPAGELQPGETPFMAVLAEGMLSPIEDMSSPSALIPIVIEAPKEALAGIQWITNPNSTLTTVVSDLREKAVARLALALDLSPDTLFGTGNASRWGQWTIEEQSIKFHIEPVMILICAALTAGFLTPSLDEAGLLSPTGRKYMYWYDASDLVQRPDQGAAAKDLYDRGELSGAALRRETGFNENDAPTGVELEVRNLLKVVALAPQAIDQLLPGLCKLLGIDISLVTVAPPDGTPVQDTAPPANPDQRPLPSAPRQPKSSPNRDGKTPADRAAA